MVPMLRPCSLAKTSSSGRRAIVPSGFMISTMTAAGARPAMRAKSTPASVWPARLRTARFGNKREDMARLLDVPWRGVRRHGLQDGVRALCRADSWPDLLGGIDRYGEIGLMLGPVIPDHQRYVQLARAPA